MSKSTLQPWQLLLVALAGWINRQQHDMIAYIQEENRILENELKGKRIRFTDDKRRRLAVKGMVLRRKALRHFRAISFRCQAGIVSGVTIDATEESCLSRMIFFGENSLRKAITEFLTHHHHERNHQSLGDRLIDPGEEVGVTEGSIASRKSLGGLLRYTYRQAAKAAWGGNSPTVSCEPSAQ